MLLIPPACIINSSSVYQPVSAAPLARDVLDQLQPWIGRCCLHLQEELVWRSLEIQQAGKDATMPADVLLTLQWLIARSKVLLTTPIGQKCLFRWDKEGAHCGAPGDLASWEGRHHASRRIINVARTHRQEQSIINDLKWSTMTLSMGPPPGPET